MNEREKLAKMNDRKEGIKRQRMNEKQRTRQKL